jgi:hypothetical protein
MSSISSFTVLLATLESHTGEVLTELLRDTIVRQISIARNEAIEDAFERGRTQGNSEGWRDAEDVASGRWR